MKQRKQGRTNHERWLVSYADFITLLFAFFVVLYASAQLDKKRVGQLSDSIQTAFQELGVFSSSNAPPLRPQLTAPAETGELPEIGRELRQVLSAEIARAEIDIHLGHEGLVISLRELGFFDSGSAELRSNAKNAFDRVAKVLQKHSCRLRIEGHTDNRPIRNTRFASNWELSTARAIQVVRILIADYHFDPRALSAAGFGEFHPVADNQLALGRQANRRVDIVVSAHPGQESSR